jgi:hypothetical protein
MRTDGFFDVVINEKQYYLSMTPHKIYNSSSRFGYYIIKEPLLLDFKNALSRFADVMFKPHTSDLEAIV